MWGPKEVPILSLRVPLKGSIRAGLRAMMRIEERGLNNYQCHFGGSLLYSKQNGPKIVLELLCKAPT